MCVLLELPAASRNIPRLLQSLLDSFRELSELVISRETVGSTLDLVSELAVQTLPSCDMASVSLVKADGISTVGSSDEVATELDAIQYQTRQGPCLDAIGKEAMWFQIDDMTSDTTWPHFSARAATKGFESLLAFTLRVDTDTLGALNLYAHKTAAFSEQDRESGAIYAAHTAIALANAQLHERGDSSRRELDEALVSQEVIARAVGILMEREFRTADEALEVLEARAEELKSKLRESAQEVVDSTVTGEVDPPVGITERMMGRARREKPPPGHRIPSPLIWAAMFAAGALVTWLLMNPQLDDARQTAQAHRAALHEALTGVEGVIELAGTAGAWARMAPSEAGTVFTADGLEEPPQGSTYQLWLFQDGEVVAGRVFDITEGVALVKMLEPATAFDRVAVTVETDGGSPKPTTDPVPESR